MCDHSTRCIQRRYGEDATERFPRKHFAHTVLRPRNSHIQRWRMALHKMRRPDHSFGHTDSRFKSYYRAIVEYAPEILALLRADGIIECANPHTEKVLGYHSHAVEGRNIFEFIHPDDI